MNHLLIALVTSLLLTGGYPDTAVKVTAAELFIDVTATLESTKNHVDHLGIKTNAYGVVNDPVNKPKLTAHNRKIAKSVGVDLDTATPEESKKVAVAIIQRISNTLSKTVPNWDKLTPESRVYMIDAKYNTGQTLKQLPKLLEQYQSNPTPELLKKVGAAARRKAGGKNTKGMDNRVARIMVHQGLIKTIDEARKYGLPLASSK